MPGIGAKEFRQMFFRNTYPSIGYRYMEIMIAGGDAHENTPTGVSEFDGIRQEVPYDRVDHIGIAIGIGLCHLDLSFYADVLLVSIRLKQSDISQNNRL